VNLRKMVSRTLTHDQVHLKIGIGEVVGEAEISQGETPECHPQQGHNEEKTPETAHHKVVEETLGAIRQQVSTTAEPVPLCDTPECLGGTPHHPGEVEAP